MAKLNKNSAVKAADKKTVNKAEKIEKVVKKPLKAKSEVTQKPKGKKAVKEEVPEVVAAPVAVKAVKKGGKKAQVEAVPEVVAPVAAKGSKKGKKEVVEEVVAAPAPTKAGKKGKKVVEEVVAAPAPVKAAKKGKKVAEPVVEAPVPAPVVKENKKKQAAAPAPVEQVVAAPAPKKKQNKKKGAAAPAPVVEEAVPAPVEAAPKGKADKKKKQAPVPVEEDSAPKQKPNKKNKKANGVAAAEPTAENGVVKPTLEAPAFDEEAFDSIVEINNVKKIAAALASITKSDLEKKKTLTDNEYKYILNVACHKIPNCPKRVVKLKLKHAMIKLGEDDIAFIVRDLQRGKRVDYEPTVQHFDDLLKSKGVEGVTILPFNQIRNEYNTFEMKRKLANQYDHYLCDGTIVSHVVGVLGSLFQNTRSTLHAVRFRDNNNIASEIKKGLRKTCYKQLSKGNLISIPVGTHKQSSAQIGENVVEVVKQLKTLYPGGLANIRNMYLRVDIPGTASLPLYVGLAQCPEETPYTIGLREQKMNKLKREANEVLSKFEFTQDGRLGKLTGQEVMRKRKIAAGRDGEEEVVKGKKPKKQKKKKAAAAAAAAEQDEVAEEEVDDVQAESADEDDE